MLVSKINTVCNCIYGVPWDDQTTKWPDPPIHHRTIKEGYKSQKTILHETVKWQIYPVAFMPISSSQATENLKSCPTTKCPSMHLSNSSKANVNPSLIYQRFVSTLSPNLTITRNRRKPWTNNVNWCLVGEKDDILFLFELSNFIWGVLFNTNSNCMNCPRRIV